MTNLPTTAALRPPPTHVGTGILPRPARTASLAALAASMSLIGCAASKAPPAVNPGRFDGPAITIVAPAADATSRAGGFHLVQVEAPSPGWQPTLDETRQAWQAREVYVTLREPSPLYFYPQVITTHTLGTTVPLAQTLRVYARVVPATAKPGDDTPYTLAAQRTNDAP